MVKCQAWFTDVTPQQSGFLPQVKVSWNRHDVQNPANAPENKPLEVRRLILETTMFRGELLVSGSVRIQGFLVSKLWFWQLFGFHLILLMAEILHQLIGSLSHYLQGFIHRRWLFGISSINSITHVFLTLEIWILCPAWRLAGLMALGNSHLSRKSRLVIFSQLKTSREYPGVTHRWRRLKPERDLLLLSHHHSYD